MVNGLTCPLGDSSDYKNISNDSLAGQFHTVLFKTINTNYMLTGSDRGLSGYYFKSSPNYIVRFSDNGMMQVTKPEQADAQKNGNFITLDYKQQYNVKGMDSKDITRLILD